MFRGAKKPNCACNYRVITKWMKSLKVDGDSDSYVLEKGTIFAQTPYLSIRDRKDTIITCTLFRHLGPGIHIRQYRSPFLRVSLSILYLA